MKEVFALLGFNVLVVSVAFSIAAAIAYMIVGSHALFLLYVVMLGHGNALFMVNDGLLLRDMHC